MRLVIAVTLVFTLGILVIGHGYFKPFGTPVGQVALLAVASLFACGLRRHEPAVAPGAHAPPLRERGHSRWH